MNGGGVRGNLRAGSRDFPRPKRVRDRSEADKLDADWDGEAVRHGQRSALMKGTEGIDYVITECGHCTSTGKCDCHNCLAREATNMSINTSGEYHLAARDERISDLKEGEFMVKCTVCAGVGKVVFWREGK